MGFFTSKKTTNDSATGAVPSSEAFVLAQAGSRFEVQNVHGADFQLALQWTMHPGANAVDLDASAVAFNGLGKIVDAAYYNQLHALGGALVHHGDSVDGAADGDDEVIDVDIAVVAAALQPTALE